MRTSRPYFSLCPECESQIHLTLAAKLQASRTGTSCICPQCGHDWVCISEWIFAEQSFSPEPPMHTMAPVPAPHFAQQPVQSSQSSTASQYGAPMHGRPPAPHLPTFQPNQVSRSVAQTAGVDQQMPIDHPPTTQPPQDSSSDDNGTMTPEWF